MNLFQVADFYLERLLNGTASNSVNVVSQSRVRVLLLDKHTTSMISMTTTQSELLNKDVYMVDTLENAERDFMRNLSCICYVKPTEDTIDLLAKELQNPRYGKYQLFFNNTVSKAQLERLAESDDLEVVTRVEEIFQDYYVVNENLFSLNKGLPEVVRNTERWSERGLEVTVRSIVSLLLSLKIRPNIYFQSNSKLCEQLGRGVQNDIEKNAKTLFDFPAIDSVPLLLLVDRLNDAMTPLLQPWTYQSMIHEYVGIKSNLVDLSHVPEISDDLKQVVLSSKQDQFFHDTMYLDFGDLGERVKNYVEQYKTKTKLTGDIETIDDIKRFIEKFPEFKKLSSNVSKHMAILGELDRQLQLRDIWQLSELEQNLSVHEDENNDYQEMLQLLNKPTLASYYKLKLACIYVLKHQTQNQKLQQIADTLRNVCSPQEVAIFYKFQSVFGKPRERTKKAPDNDLISGLTKKFNKMSHSSADNVYMQHTPALADLLNDLSKDKFPTDMVTGIGGVLAPTAPLQDIVIFVVGGATLEEARIVHQFNATMKNQNSSLRIVYGSNNILTTASFLEDFRQMHCTSERETELDDLL